MTNSAAATFSAMTFPATTFPVTTSPVMTETAETLEDLDRRHLIHPNKRGERDDRCVIVRGKGCTLWDAQGRELLDVTGGLWLSQVGHGREEIAEAAGRQTAELEYFAAFWEFSNDKAIRLAARLAEVAPPGINRVFYTSGGSEGNDTAIKAARLYHRRRGEPDRTWIISRQRGYHGATYGGGTLTGFPARHEPFAPNLPHIAHVTAPWPYRTELYDGQDPTDFLLRELEQTIEEIGPRRVAAMIGEPIIGAGGVLVPPPDYWPRVRELLDRYGILLVADEVITAFGRIGSWFDSASKSMDPDMIITAKGMTSGYAPLGAVLMSEEVGETLAGGDGFPHGYTYFGHPVACAVGLANLEIIERENLLDRAPRIGDLIRAELAPAAEFPVVGEIRGQGAMVAIELVTDKATREPMSPLVAEKVSAAIRNEHHVIVRDMLHVLVIGPPLILEEHQARRAVAAVLDVLSRLSPDGHLA